MKRVTAFLAVLSGAALAGGASAGSAAEASTAISRAREVLTRLRFRRSAGAAFLAAVALVLSTASVSDAAALQTPPSCNDSTGRTAR